MISFLFTLLLCTQGIQILVKDQCSGCSAYLSKSDCQISQYCAWKDNICIDAPPPKQINTYCDQFSSLCAQTNGCAWINNKCTNFAGCTAYVKTTTRECHQISNRCISNGKACIEALECSKYNEKECNTTPNKFDRNCKWEKKICRDYHCSEADFSFNTDDQCNQFAYGCITTGAGCINPPLPPCSQFQYFCNLLKGSDGFCDFNKNSTNCQAKSCDSAPQYLSTDQDCQQYQIGCITTGKGCTSQLKECQSYQVAYPEIQCKGYIGIDGICEGDKGMTKCRNKICENRAGVTDQQCNEYKQGCITNGKYCVSNLQKCSQYSGNIITCQGYIGIDGQCKGEQNQNNCKLKDCIEDSDIKYNTDELCQQNIQKWCLTNGKGCVNILQQCNTYQNDCINRIGLEGKCKEGQNGYCDAILCSEASKDLKTNEECNKFQKRCVTNGKGCFNQTTCSDTLEQITCQGTYENQTQCNWSGNCIESTSCSCFTTKSLCQRYKYYQNPCFWDSGVCRLAVCKDYQYTQDKECGNALSGCITNGKSCADPNDCSQFQGTQATCLGYKAYCTNFNDTQTTCIKRTCENAPNDLNTDLQCSNYLPTCLTKGSGCIQNSKDCSFYTGNKDSCKNFTGQANNKRIQCWSNNTSDGACVTKTCNLAESMKQDSDCQSFLTGCKFNGQGSCIESGAECSSYIYTSDNPICQNFKGKNGQISCWQGSNNYCRNRQCSDYNKTNPSNEDCNTFLVGCVSNGSNCVPQTTPCNNFTGTVEQCNSFFGNSLQCTKVTNCKSKVCSEKRDAKSNKECLNYHSKCRLPNLGGSNCREAEPRCNGYTFNENQSNSDKYTYCNTITTTMKNICSFDPNIVNCVERKSCNQWTTGIEGVDCANYLGVNTCSLNTNDSQCYTIGSCSTYKIPDAVIQAKLQTAWCSSISDFKQVNCSYDTLNTTYVCTDYTICESILNPTTQVQCLLNCQYLSHETLKKCITTQNQCTQYSLENITIPKATYCSKLKAVYNSEVIPCKYDQMIQNHCVAITCSDIISNQSDCQALKGCKYNSGICYLPKECSSYTISGQNLWEDRLKCQNFLNNNQKYCSYAGSGQICSDPIMDCQSIQQTSVESCGKFRLSTGEACHYSYNQNCDQPQSDVCSTVINISVNSCDLYTKIGSCDNAQGNCVFKPNCSNQVTKNSSPDEKARDCQQFTDSIGQHCSWRSSSSGCEIAPSQCTDWNNLTTTVDNTTFCQLRIDRQGYKCTYDIGTNSCRQEYFCELALLPKSQIDCDIISKGCFYKASSCMTKKDQCNQYKVIGNSDDTRLYFCNNLTNNSQKSCTFLIKSLYCTTNDICNTYKVSQLTSEADKINACSMVSTTNLYGCTYWNNSNTCLVIGACNTYTVYSAKDLSVLCGSQKDQNGKTCYGNIYASSCSQFSKCEHIINANSIGDCNKYIDGCVYNSNKCFSQKKDCKYQAPGKGSINFCAGFMAGDDKCTAANDTAQICQNRTCQDDYAKTLTTNLACQSYKSTCKSDGTKCIDASTKCSQISAVDCTLAFDFDNVSTCELYPSTCINKDCNINDISTTDNDCNIFRKGCVTNGKGCVESTAPCSEYIGTIDTCQNYTGNQIKCWGNYKDTIDYCKNRLCTDNKIAISDSECQTFLNGCVTTGQGCVQKGSPCSVYNGNQETCQKFTGLSNNCWSLSIKIVLPCVERSCHYFEGSTDVDCQQFMSNCVTNGKRCVPNQTICSQFLGNYHTCPKFTAADGPCKAINYSLQESYCTPRVCNEAPNNFYYEWQCYQYHPSCVTTGHGCIAKGTTKCQDLTQQYVCNYTYGCQWIDQCKAPPSNCDSITSQSICIYTILNDGITKCAWSNGLCRKITCADYDVSVTTHDDCKSMNHACTTNGAGCVLLGLCISYSDPQTCFAATTTESSIRCTWDDRIGQCRQRQCRDNTTYTKDSDCDEFLKGCKTRGRGCIEPQFTCQEYNTWDCCISDGFGNPCIFVNGQCYNYTKCTDVKGQTLSDCQAFNQLCVPGPQSCIAQKSSCDQYNYYESCKIATDWVRCGWLPHGVCQIFGKCSDLISTSNQDCQNYGSNCITDGIKCIDKQLCSTYLIYAACINGGTDGKCTWESNLCRLTRCTDKYSSSESECEQFTVKEGICTTDGNQCILKIEQNCQNYLTETRCTYSVKENKCIFSYPVGQTKGNKSCRASQCEDFPVIDNNYCQYANNYQYCTFDGSKCVREENCSKYIKKKLCNNWGRDGVCVFTPSLNDPQIGTCQKFTYCEQANQDKQACNRKPDSCYWNINQCEEKNCSHLKNANDCNLIPKFDNIQFTICSFVIDKCVESDPAMFSEKDCLMKSLYTYTWNAKTKQCVPCKNKEETTQQIYLDLSTYSNFIHLFILIFIFHF